MGATEIATTIVVDAFAEAVMISTTIVVDEPNIATAMVAGSSRPFAGGCRGTGPTGTIDVAIDAGFGREAITCILRSAYGSHLVAAMAGQGRTAVSHVAVTAKPRTTVTPSSIANPPHVASIRPMNCRQAERALSRHLDDELPANDVATLEEHLASCSACRDSAAEWRGLGDAMRAEAPSEVPDPTKAWHDIRRTLRNREPPTVQENRRPWWARPLPWAGAAATVALITLGYLRHVSPSSQFPSGSAVEYVDTELPGASTVVYVDDETGWNIVWVLESETEPDPLI